MRYTLALLALVGAAFASPMPQGGVTAVISPPAPAPTGCSTSHSGTFEITVSNVTSNGKRDLVERQKSGALMLTLAGGILKDQAGRTGYIAANYQFQFDQPVQAGAIFTAGFSLCGNGSLALGGSAIFYQCLSGNFFNLYDRHWAAQCNAIYISLIGAAPAPPPAPTPQTITSALVSVKSEGQPVPTSVVTTIASEKSDGQPVVTSISERPDGQPIMTVVPVPVTQIGDGQVQASTGPAVSQISDGQVQASTHAPAVSQISDGQVQATSAPAVSQISDGQVQATSAPVVSQISDGQVQATSAAPPAVSQISDGQVQATTAPAVSQISDGQVQATKAAPPAVSQISDGQVQATTAPAVSEKSEGQPVVTSAAVNAVSQASTTSSGPPAAFTGGAAREISGQKVMAMAAGIVGAVALL